MPSWDEITVDKIFWAHEYVVEEFDLEHGDTSHPMPRYVLSRIVNDAESIENPDLKAASILRRLISAHVFEDGNKRTAWVVARHTLRQSGFEPPVDDRDVDTVLRHISRYSTEEIATWLRDGKIDRSKMRDNGDA